MQGQSRSDPLQSSSKPFPQTSVVGWRALQLPQLPAEQVSTPPPHAVEQERCIWSITPSQSSSTPLQTSVEGGGALQLPQVPATQVSTPAPHTVPQDRCS